MNHLHQRRCLALALAALVPAALIAAAPARAATTIEALTFTDSGNGGAFFAGADVGYSFTVAAPVTVTDLGAYFQPNSGFFIPSSVPVGLYDSAGNLLASATVS